MNDEAPVAQREEVGDLALGRVFVCSTSALS